MTRFACVQHVLNTSTICVVGRMIATVVQILFATGSALVTKHNTSVQWRCVLRVSLRLMLYEFVEGHSVQKKIYIGDRHCRPRLLRLMDFVIWLASLIIEIASTAVTGLNLF